MATAQMTPSTSGSSPARRSASRGDLFRSLSDTMDRLSRDMGLLRGWPFEASSTPGSGDVQWMPDVEVQQRDGTLHVRADLPGLKKEDIKVEIADGMLTLEGERTHTADEKRDGYYRTERSYGRFYRCLALPEGVNADSATASFKDGVLEITVDVPKSEASSPRRLEIG